MKRLRDGLYVIEPERYAERRGAEWFVTDEEEQIVSGPYASLERLEEARIFAEHDFFDSPPPGKRMLGDDLVTLRQAAKHLPVTHQALYARRRTGGLPAPAVVQEQPSGRTMEFYNLSELAALFEGKTLVERVTEGNRRSWERLSDAERAERIAKIQKGRS